MNAYIADRPEFAKKHFHDVNADWNRVRLFADIVSQVDDLTTATPLRIDSERGYIYYDLLTDYCPLLQTTETITTQLQRVGALLAQFHNRPLPSKNSMGRLTREDYPIQSFGLSHEDKARLTELPSGMFFGDCWHGNILKKTDGKIVFIDPIPSYYMFDYDYITANGSLDLATLHMSLLFCHPLGQLIRNYQNQFISAGDSLIQGYLEEAGVENIKPVILRLSRLLACRYIKTYPRRLGWPLGKLKLLVSRKIMRDLDKQIPWK